MLKLIEGRSGSGKTTHLFDCIRDDQRPGAMQYLIVPDQSTLQYEDRLMRHLGVEGLMDIEVLSFSRLVDRTLDQTGRPLGQAIDEIGKTMLLGKVFKELKSSGAIFGKGLNRMGFLGVFQDMLREFRQCGIQPGDLAGISEAAADPAFAMKVGEIATVYAAFEARMENGFLDEERLYDRAALQIGDMASFRGAHFYIDGFNGFTHQEYLLMEQLLATGCGITVAMTHDHREVSLDYSLFEPARKTLERLVAMADGLGLGSQVTRVFLEVKDPIRPQELHHLERHLYAWPTKTFKHDAPAVTLMPMTHPLMEVEAAATEMMRLIRDEGARYRDMAVVVGSMEEYGPLIGRVFSEYGIPCFLDEKRTIRSNPVVRALEAALSAVVHRYRHDDIFRLVKSGMVPMTRETTEKLENFCLEQGIKGGKWLKAWTGASSYRLSEEALSELEEARLSIIVPLDELSKKIRKGTPLRLAVEAVYHYMKTMDFHGRLQQRLEDLKTTGHLETASGYAQTWNLVMAILDQAALVAADEIVSGEELLEILQTGFDAYRMGLIPPSPDKIQVGSFDRSVFGRTPWLFALGMNDGKVPRIKTTSGVLTNADKVKIREKGFFVRSELSEVNSEESYVLYSILTSADRGIWLSCAQSDKEGKALRPSVLMERVKKLLPGARVLKPSDMGKAMQQIGSPLATLRHLVARAREQKEMTENAPDLGLHYDPEETAIWQAVAAWFKDDAHWRAMMEHAMAGLDHNNQQEKLDAEIAAQVFPAPLTSSVSRLEQFRNCPFSHLVRYGLRPEERREFELAMPDMGTIFHKAVELYGRDLLDDYENTMGLSPTQLYGRMAAYVDDAVGRFGSRIFSETAYGRFAVSRIKRVAVKAAETIADHLKQGRFVPSSYELGFGGRMNSDIPPLIIDAGSAGKVVLEGRIDRVDFFENEDGLTFVRVIDYKSGAKSFDASEVLHGLQLQLMLYLDAVLSNAGAFRKDELYPAGAFYFRIHDPMLTTAEEQPEVLAEAMKKALRMDGVMVKDLKILQAMDQELEPSSDSSVVPVKLKKDGEPGENGRLLEPDEFGLLIKYAENMAGRLGQSIIEGCMRAEPVKSGERTACDLCSYRGICQFDTRLDDNHFDTLKKMDRKRVAETLKEFAESSASEKHHDEDALGGAVKEVKPDAPVDGRSKQGY